MTKHSERRSSFRRPIHHKAEMKTVDGTMLSCVIIDFCLDGMFVKMLSETSSRNISFSETGEESTKVELSFCGDQGQEYSVHANVVHYVKGACGLRFIQRYDPAMQSLVNVSTNAEHKKDHSQSVQNILGECIRFIDMTFGGLLDIFWGVLEEALRTEAVNASDDQTANAYMALSDRVKHGQTSLHAGVMKAINDPVAAFNLHIEKRQSMTDQLAVIDKNEFEDWLVARVLVVRCEADYQTLLMTLKLRLDALGVGDKRHHQSVFDPALLVSAFQPVIQSLIVDTVIEKLVFKTFEQYVMSDLNNLYEGLNAILVRHNILPKLDFKQPVGTGAKQKTTRAKLNNSDQGKTAASTAHKKLSPTAQASSATNTSRSGVLNNPNVNVDTQSQAFTVPPFSSEAKSSTSTHAFSENQQTAQTALKHVSQLLGNLRKQELTGSARDNNQPIDVYSASEFEESLMLLQTAYSEDTGDESPKALIERVQTHLSASGDVKEIDEGQKAAIDVVDRFFLSMRDNPRISAEAKQYLSKLEVPVLKVLLKDEQFFDDEKSSVRAVMNRIAQLGATGSKLNPSSREKLSGLVHKIVEEFEQDTAIFDSTLSELDSLLERQNNLYVKNVERVAAAAEGTHKVDDANVEVTAAINERVAHKFVPSAVVTLINEGWREYLNLTFIKQGPDSDAWRDALAVLDDLIACGNNPRIPIEIRVILPKIQEGLKTVSGTNEASTTVRDALKAFILNAPKGKHLREQAQQYVVPEKEEDLLARNIHKSQALKSWILKIKDIPLGTWLTLKKDEQHSTYMRLVWVAKGFSKFVFVNHQGMKVVELGLFKLASYFKEGRVAIDADYERPIVNQGLDNMVKDVYDKLAYDASHDAKTGLINKVEFCRQVGDSMKQGKRTSECRLLFIRFRDTEKSEACLDERFSNEVVKIIDGIFGNDAILGRISETDFAMFNILSESDNAREDVQGGLINLCMDSEWSASNLLVMIGESKAHLGFHNPEAMIQHASAAIIAREARTTEEDEASGGEEDVFISDEAANASTDDQDFDTLVFDLWGQDASEIVYDQSNNEGASQVGKNINGLVHLNLFNVVRGAKTSYVPENEACIHQLDSWWIDKLVELSRDQAQIFSDYHQVRVQLSGLAFNSDELVEQLISVSHTQKLQASNICFDIYDCFQLQDIELSSMRMNRLKNMGYSFCLDHFGSDRSPFSYLKTLPVDMIKIDDAFISALSEEHDDEGGDERAEVIAAESIVEIAHYMGKKVLATGVDSAVCLQKMKHLKVDFVQGSTISELVKYPF